MKLKTYWVNTSGNDLIRKLLLEITNENWVSIEKLIEGRSIRFRYDDKITYKSFDDFNDLNNILNIMFVSGDLTVNSIIKEANIEMIYLKIPNMEVMELMTDIISCKSLEVIL